MKILVIEDDASIRRFVIGLLRRMFAGAAIEATEFADEAIALIKAATLDRPYDFVISDYNLVGLRTGGDVLEWIKDHASYLEPRFLFFSSDEKAAALHKHYIEKPCDTTALRAAIELVLNESRS